MREFFQWMSDTPWSIALRESFFVWPIVEATHVITLMAFVGTIVMVDLRLLGIVLPNARVSQLTEKVLPWTVGAFIVLVVTGLALFYAKPLVYYHSVFFRVKMVVLLLALANIIIFHKQAQAHQSEWDEQARLPGPVRMSALVSLSAWMFIVIVGRMIAYDWYNCEKLEPGGFLHAVCDCPDTHDSNAGS